MPTVRSARLSGRAPPAHDRVPYAPELNPIEYVWGYLKLNPLANLAFFDLEQLTTTARRHTRSLQRKPTFSDPS